ncbi:hypothetical protein [Pusillimonas noertemannii]|uniref:Uncharacterized protein n=1 Tax=Pusillimonas noertemannii TaxID=305977 RepID=A0A2U1CJW7_9BURK|nr:hypothetical protein [Pusillimonas noertemannii]NYT69783.1 hypothetical protein [Pusillimonas noertemannii]PVY61293.1 hypothetical protein C7440_2843 [Pusillimonas noertemannii]
MNISLQTLETLHRLTSQDTALLDNLYAVRSLEQAVDVVADSARRLCVSIDRGEVVSYFENSLTGVGPHD